MAQVRPILKDLFIIFLQRHPRYKDHCEARQALSLHTCASAVSARFSGLLREASGSCSSSRSASIGLLSAM